MLDLSQNAVTDQLQIGHASHAGRSGKNNEDYYGVFSVATAGGECVVAAVADGIGGSVGGEQASRLAINAMHNSLNDPLYVATSLGQRLDQAIRLANRQIYERSQNEPALAGMGTTIVAVALDGERLYVAHAGDSRAYLIRGGRAHQLTLDHSWAQEAIEAGRIKPEEAKTHPNRHVIRRFLGINEEVETDPRVVDPAQAGSGRAATVASPILTQGGDAILLCSDGLTDEVSDEEIARLVGKHAPADAARRLIDAANAAGGADNITAVILQRGAGKPAAAAGRSRLAAIGLALMAALIVGALGWLIASGALFGKPDGGVAAPVETPGMAAAVAATSTPVAASDMAARPTAEATAAATAAATAEATAEATPVAPTSTSVLTPTLPPTDQATATAMLEPTSTPNPTNTPQSESNTTKPITDTAAAELDAAGASPRVDASAAGAGAAISTTDSLTTTTPMTATVEQPDTAAGAPALPPTSTPAVRGTSTPTVTPTPLPTPRIAAAAPTRSAPPMPSSGTAADANVVPPPPPPPTVPAAAPAAIGGPSKLTSWSASSTTVNENDFATFTWSADAPLAPDQVFELVFWRAYGETYNQGRAVNEASPSMSVTVKPSLGLPPDSYKWGVFLTRKDSWERIHFLGEGGSLSVAGSGDDPKTCDPTLRNCD